MKEKIKRVVAYLRESAHSDTIEIQEEIIQNYCERRGWKNIKFFKEVDAEKQKTRPVMEEMIREIRKGKVDVLVVTRMDRFGRKTGPLVLLLDEMKKLKVMVVCVEQGLETDDSMLGVMTARVLAAFAELERDLIGERTRNGMKAAKARGARLGRPATTRQFAEAVVMFCEKGLGVRESAHRLGISPASVTRLLASAQEPANRGRGAGGGSRPTS